MTKQSISSLLFSWFLKYSLLSHELRLLFGSFLRSWLQRTVTVIIFLLMSLFVVPFLLILKPSAIMFLVWSIIIVVFPAVLIVIVFLIVGIAIIVRSSVLSISVISSSIIIVVIVVVIVVVSNRTVALVLFSFMFILLAWLLPIGFFFLWMIGFRFRIYLLIFVQNFFLVFLSILNLSLPLFFIVLLAARVHLVPWFWLLFMLISFLALFGLTFFLVWWFRFLSLLFLFFNWLFNLFCFLNCWLYYFLNHFLGSLNSFLFGFILWIRPESYVIFASAMKFGAF